jgi:hypothetical protein
MTLETLLTLAWRGALARYNLIRPRRVASATASVRLTTFILAKMAFPCDLTVPPLMKRAEAISLLLFPLAMSFRTSISRLLRLSEFDGFTTVARFADNCHVRFVALDH